jgi:hypothetical protein
VDRLKWATLAGVAGVGVKCGSEAVARADGWKDQALVRPMSEKLLRRNVKRSRGGLVFKAHRRLYHSTIGSIVM